MENYEVHPDLLIDILAAVISGRNDEARHHLETILDSGDQCTARVKASNALRAAAGSQKLTRAA